MVESRDPMTLAVAAELRAYRAVKRRTIEEVSKSTGISSRQLARLFNGERDIDVKVIDLLATALDFEPDELWRRARSRKATFRSGQPVLAGA